jgi:hypothetical protein
MGQHDKLIAHYREAVAGHREDYRRILEPVLEPLLAVVVWTVDRPTNVMRVLAMGGRVE